MFPVAVSLLPQSNSLTKFVAYIESLASSVLTTLTH